ncbi:MAG: cupin domain-containing protein [Pseudomonadota bacterium]
MDTITDFFPVLSALHDICCILPSPLTEHEELNMALEPGPMQVIHNFFSTKAEVLDDIKKLDLWPTTYVSDRMEELPLHWHDTDNCGYVLEGSSYVLNEHGEQVKLGPGDKLVIPAGALHAEGEVTERMVYIVGIPEAANLFEKLTLLSPETSPLKK